MKDLYASKTLIIHDGAETFSLIGLLSNTKKERPILDYLTINHLNRKLNIFECSEVFIILTKVYWWFFTRIYLKLSDFYNAKLRKCMQKFIIRNFLPLKMP